MNCDYFKFKKDLYFIFFKVLDKSKQVKMTNRMEIHYIGDEKIESNRNSIQVESKGGIEISPFDKRMQINGNEEQSRETKSPIQTIKEYHVVQKQIDYSETADNALQSVDYDSLIASIEKNLPDDLIVTNQIKSNPRSFPFTSEQNTKRLQQKPTNLKKCKPERSFHQNQQHKIIKRSIGRPSTVNLLSNLLHIKDSTSQEVENRNKMLASFLNLSIGNQPGQTIEHSTNSQEHLQQHADQQNNDQQIVRETPMLQCEMNTVINVNLSIQNPGITILVNLNQHNQVIGQNCMIPIGLNIQNLIASNLDITDVNDNNTVVST
jgi:hypothetical protein